MTGRKPNAPAGVVRSPSRLWSETPRCPSQAVQVPETARQQPPVLRQRRSEPCVDALRGATTVTSCVAERVGASWFAGFAGQEPPVCAPPGAAAAARQSGRQISAIHLMTPCRLCGDEAPVARPARRPAAVRALRLARDPRAAPVLVAPRLPGGALAAPAGAPLLLELRRAGAHGRARRQRLCGRRRRPGLPAAVRGAVPDPAHAADRRVPRRGRALARSRQHRRLQLPLCGRAWAEAL